MRCKSLASKLKLYNRYFINVQQIVVLKVTVFITTLRQRKEMGYFTLKSSECNWVGKMSQSMRMKTWREIWAIFAWLLSLLAGECINSVSAAIATSILHWTELFWLCGLQTSNSPGSSGFQGQTGTTRHPVSRTGQLLDAQLSLCSLQSLLDCLIHTYCVNQSNESVYICIVYIIFLYKEVPGGISSQKEGTHSLQPGNLASITASRKERRNSEA